MARVTLVKQNPDFAERINELSMAPEVREALGLPVCTVEDTRDFIKSIMAAEAAGKNVPRVILNEAGEVIGHTDLMFINHEKKRCHIGSWIGHEYWGQGYNQASKVEILRIAFEELGLEHVFAGARVVNIRSQKAQEKLPFIRLHVEDEFPDEHEWLEKKEKQKCVLHAFYREDFMKHLEATQTR